jgi:hypothetical protein
MFLDFIGIIFATLIIIIQEFLKDKIKEKWIKIVLFCLIIGSFVYSGIQIFDNNQSKEVSINENSKLKKQIDSLFSTNRLIKQQNDSLLIKVNLINDHLNPFILIAKNKYPNLKDNEALEMLTNEIQYVKKELKDTREDIKDAKISKIDKSFVNKNNFVQAQLRFYLTNKNIRDKINFEIYLPDNSKVDILDFEFLESVGLTNFDKRISDDKKSAYMYFNFSGAVIPSFGVNLTRYSEFLIKSNYLEQNIIIK